MALVLVTTRLLSVGSIHAHLLALTIADVGVIIVLAQVRFGHDALENEAAPPP